MTLLTDFMQHTGLTAEQVEQLVARRSFAVRLSPNCPYLQPAPDRIGPQTGPLPNHYGACYVNGIGPGAELSNAPEPAPKQTWAMKQTTP